MLGRTRDFVRSGQNGPHMKQISPKQKTAGQLAFHLLTNMASPKRKEKYPPDLNEEQLFYLVTQIKVPNLLR